MSVGEVPAEKRSGRGYPEAREGEHFTATPPALDEGEGAEAEGDGVGHCMYDSDPFLLLVQVQPIGPSGHDCGHGAQYPDAHEHPGGL